MYRSRLPKKSLGQHFLICQWVAKRMRDTAQITAQDTILEIGPGRGALTLLLAQNAGRVVAVEKDRMLADELSHILTRQEIKNVTVLTGDIRNFFTNDAKKQELKSALWHQSYKVVASIPYYLSSRLLRLLLTTDIKPLSLTLLVQKELGERIIASPPRMNLLALSVQVFGVPRLITAVPASCFTPKPNVDSAILTITDLSDHFFATHVITPDAFFALARHAFTTKRKLLNNALRTYASLSRNQALRILDQCKLPRTARPEMLTQEQWACLTNTTKTV